MATINNGESGLSVRNKLNTIINKVEGVAAIDNNIDVTGTVTADGLTVAGNVSVDGGTIKLDGNYPVGTSNVALGDQALNESMTGQSNVAIGSAAGVSVTSGSHNTAIGTASLLSNTTGGNNTGIGRDALRNNTTASYNTAVGYQAGYSNTTAGNSTAVGYRSLYSNTTGFNQTATGYMALFSNTTGSYNSSYGLQALFSNTTGEKNVGVGDAALFGNTTGSNNTAIGKDALIANTTASNNTAVGYQALDALTTAGNNTAVGFGALGANTTGAGNTAVGLAAGGNLTTGSSNTFIGYKFGGNGSGQLITTGSKNTILGPFDGNQGGLDIRTSSNNIVLSDGDGNPRIQVNSSGGVGIGGTATGNAAMLYVDHPVNLDTTLPTVKILRDNNSGGGSGGEEVALEVSIPATYNSNTPAYAIKAYAEQNLDTSAYAIFAEVNKSNSDTYYAGYFKGGHSDTNGTRVPKVVGIEQATIIGASNSGYSIGLSITQDDYTKNEFQRWSTDYSGTDTMNALRIYRNGSQVGGITTTASSTAFNTSSDYRLKENVVDLTGATDRIKQIPVHRFNFIVDPNQTVDGFLAHEVQAIVPEAVTGQKDGMTIDENGNEVPDYQSIDQSKLVPLLVATIKELEARIAALEAK